MAILQFYKEAWKIIRSTKLLWLFGLIGIIPISISSLVQPRHPQLMILCLLLYLFLLLIFSALFVYAGLIFITYRRYLGQEVSFQEAWSVFISVFWRMSLVAILALIIGGIPSLLCWLLTFACESCFSSFIGLWGLLRILLFYFFTISLMMISFQALIIHGIGVFASLWHSVLVVTNNVGTLFIIFIIPYILWLVEITLVVGITAILRPNFSLYGLFPLSIKTFSVSTGLPIARLITIISSVFYTPYISIVTTLAYLSFTNKVEYPALRRKTTSLTDEIASESK
jgi:hypothetical protein